MKNPARSTSHCHRAFRAFALVAALGLAAIGLSQCRMVSDNVAGVELTADALCRRNNCVRECNKDYEDAMEREEDRHRAALKKCGHDRSCKNAENAKHKDIKEAILDARKECKKKCYNEGSGGGGR
jgi:hypothetical protein